MITRLCSVNGARLSHAPGQKSSSGGGSHQDRILLTIPAPTTGPDVHPATHAGLPAGAYRHGNPQSPPAPAVRWPLASPRHRYAAVTGAEAGRRWPADQAIAPPSGRMDPNWTPARGSAVEGSAEIPALRGRFRGVDDGTRTHDRLDHNQELYQLSYVHRGRLNLASELELDAGGERARALQADVGPDLCRARDSKGPVFRPGPSLCRHAPGRTRTCGLLLRRQLL